jgi:hypothetical protein
MKMACGVRRLGGLWWRGELRVQPTAGKTRPTSGRPETSMNFADRSMPLRMTPPPMWVLRIVSRWWRGRAARCRVRNPRVFGIGFPLALRNSVRWDRATQVSNPLPRPTPSVPFEIGKVSKKCPKAKFFHPDGAPNRRTQPPHPQPIEGKCTRRDSNTEPSDS